MPEIGKAIVVFGAIVVLLGLAIWSGFGRGWFGQLPGDIHHTGKNFSFHFPIVTSLIISAVLSLLMWLFRR
jgi:hypothetical protein